MRKNTRVKKRFTSEVNIIDFQPYLPAKKQRVIINARNANQKSYLSKLYSETTSIVFAIGPAGTGKTMLAVQYGIKLFQEGIVDKIVVTRPAVSVDEDLGFLPGTLNEKMAPWTRPIFDVLGEYYQTKDIAKMLEEGVIEISPLAYMRGRTFKNAYIIADEMQNATPAQCKMLMTRIGTGSRIIITGDIEQADRNHGDNGLMDLVERLREGGVKGIAVCELQARDVQRHEIITSVLKLYHD